LHGVVAAAEGLLLVRDGELLEDAEGFRVISEGLEEALVLS
jgi:hypothetical protein